MYRIIFFSFSLFFLVNTIAHSSNSIFTGSREGDPESIIKNVSTIHGDYSEREVDLLIPGPDPLILSRFYSSKDSLDIATFGGWRLNPQTFFLICPNPERDGYQSPARSFECLDIYVGTPEGSLLKFSGFQNWDNPEVRSEFYVDLEEDEVGICNTARGSPSSWTNAKNHVLYYDPKNKSFELHISSGGKRTYIQGSSKNQFFLSLEKLPSGNQISYEYDQTNRLKQIKMTNASGSKSISWISLEYGSSITATASDGTCVEYALEKDTSGALLLSKVKNSSRPSRTYRYHVGNGKALLTRKELPGGGYFGIEYEKAFPYRVTALLEPLQEGVVNTTSFAYGEGVTKVQGLQDQQTSYYYDDENRLSAVEETLNNVPFRIRKKQWGEWKNQGNLISLSIEDGDENTLYFKTFSYDAKGNILEENEFGNLTGHNPLPLIFDGVGVPESNQECLSKQYSYQKTENEEIVSQINEQGNGTLFAYLCGTSILKRKEIHQKKVAKRRFFYDYNEDGSLVRITLDNGGIRDKTDPDYAAKKFITVITPKQELPNIGAPQVIEERAYDEKTGREILLKKSVNHFDAHGLVIKQDIYDREDTYLYSLETGYDSAGRITSQKDPLGNQTNYTYDTSGNLIQEETFGLTLDYDYDLQNNIIGIVRSGKNFPAQKATFAYDAKGNKTLEIDALGNKTEFHFDSLGRLIQKTTVKKDQTPENATWTYSYDLFDHPVTITDPLNNATAIEYNVRGKPIHIVCDGREESFTYSLEGSLLSHLTSQGITKTFEYDYLGRTKRVNYFERGSKCEYKTDAYFYDAFHLLSERTSNGEIKYTYDNKGELIQSTCGQKGSHVWWSNGISSIENGESTDFAYDLQGRLIETKKWKDKTHYTLYLKKYDLLGRVVEERIEDEGGKLLHTKQFTYTPLGELVSEIGFPHNQESVLAEYSYDPLGRISQVKRESSIWDITHEEAHGVLLKTTIDPLGSITEESFNSEGLLLSRIQKDPKGSLLLDEQFAFDALNNLTEEKNSNFEISYAYLPGALRKSIVLAGKVKQSFTYNSYGELTHCAVPAFEKDVEYTYDRRGNLRSITYQEAPKGQAKRYTLTSDERGNVAKIIQDDAFTLEKTYNTHGKVLTENIKDKWGSYEVSFQYDGEGCLTEITLPDQSSILYIYEGPFVSKIRRLSKTKEELYSYEVTDRDLMGNVLQETLPKNLGIRRNTYDTQGRKVEIITDFFRERAIFDLLGNPIQKITKKGHQETTTHFTYDPLSQLTSEGSNSYRYDYRQNLVLKDDVPYDMTPYNQVAKGSDFTCEYDEGGNLKSLSDSSGNMELHFDALGRLAIAKTPEGKTIHYAYDPDLRRMSKVIDKDHIERYFYLSGYELGAMDKQGKIKALRIPINPNELESTSILTIELENENYFPFSDLRRNIRCLVNLQKRSVVESYDFSAYGEEQIFTPRKKISKSRNPWRFQGKRHERETGLIYYGARYYSPKLHKWISPDPLGSSDSLNLYQFCRNNPLKYQDPWGLASISEECGCVNHDHPGYHNRPSDCICICGQGGFNAKMSGVVVAVADFAVDTWQNPRFQGGLQAFGGFTEAMIGGGIALGSGYLGAPIGGLVMSHGLDHFFTGLQTAFSGNPRNSVTNQLLQQTGMSSQTASLVDGGLSIVGSVGGVVVIRASQLAAFPSFPLPILSNSSDTYVNRATSFAGSKRAPLNYAPYQKIRNESAVINGRKYTGHALDRMQDRGLMPSIIENAVNEGQTVPGSFSGTLEYYDVINKVKVVVNENGQIITIIPGRR